MLYCKIEEYIPGKKEKKINKIPKIKYELKLMIKIMSKLANKSFPNLQGTAIKLYYFIKLTIIF